MTIKSPSSRRADASLHPAVGARREVDAVTMLTVYLVLLLALPSGMTITALGSLGRPSLIWGLILLVWWAVSRLQASPTHAPRVSQPVLFAFGAFFVIALISFAAALLHGQPGDQLSPAMTAIIRLLSWAGVLLVAVQGVRTKDELSTMVRRIGIGAGLLAALGLLQFLTGQALVDFFQSIPGLSMTGGPGQRAGVLRSSGTAVHPLEYATALNAALPLVIAAAVSRGFRPQASRAGLWWWLPVGLITFSSLLAVSRSAIIGFVVAVISMLPVIPRRYIPAALGVGAVITLSVVAAVPGLFSTTIALFTGAANDPSTQSRTDGLAEVPGFMEPSPLIGSGFGIFLPRYYIFDNEWVLIAVELGILGVLAFAGMLVAAMWSAGRAKFSHNPDSRLIGHALAASMFNVAVLFAFFDGLSFPIAGGILFLLLGLCASVRTLAASNDAPETANDRNPDFPPHGGTA
jgi:hypothetical protein